MWDAIKARFDLQKTIVGTLIVFVWVLLSLSYENSIDSGIAASRYLYRSTQIKEFVGQAHNHVLLGADFKRSRLHQCAYLRYIVFGDTDWRAVSLRLTKYDDEQWVVKEAKLGLYPSFDGTCYQ